LTRYIALFRGLNVGGSHKVPMADLREMLAGLGFANVKTYIQSGNAVFDSDQTAAAASAAINPAFEAKFEFSAPLVLLDAGQLDAVIAASPFAGPERFQDKWTRLSGSETRSKKEIEPCFDSVKTGYALTDDYKMLHAGFFVADPSPERLAILNDMPRNGEKFAVKDRVIYLYLPNYSARSDLAKKVASANLGAPVTVRNWRSVCALSVLAKSTD